MIKSPSYTNKHIYITYYIYFYVRAIFIINTYVLFCALYVVGMVRILLNMLEIRGLLLSVWLNEFALQ